jgi:predicted Rossmann-fold nucleotide-binding protein
MANVILVCGGREYWSDDVVNATLDSQWLLDPADALVHGGCYTGADRLADRWARPRGVPVRVYKADWDKHGKAAGPIRNQLMLDTESPRLIIAFPGGSGTADMCRRAERAGVEIWRV